VALIFLASICCAMPVPVFRWIARDCSIATVERGSFVRDVAADGQVARR